MTDRFRRWGIAASYRARQADFDSVKTSETRSMDEATVYKFTSPECSPVSPISLRSM
jgi:hypothetical protein